MADELKTTEKEKTKLELIENSVSDNYSKIMVLSEIINGIENKLGESYVCDSKDEELEKSQHRLIRIDDDIRNNNEVLDILEKRLSIISDLF